MLLLMLLLLAAPAEETAETPETPKVAEIKKQIATVDDDLERLQKRLSNIDEDSTKLSDELGLLDLQQAVVLGQIDKHELELARADERLAINRAEQNTLQEQAAGQRARLSERLRKLYKRGSLGYSQLFLKQSRLKELINAYHYAAVLTNRDHQALTEYQDTLERLQLVEATLNKIKAEADQTRLELEARRKELNRLIAARADRLNRIRKEKTSSQRLLQELELEKEELYLLIRRLTDENSDPMELRIPMTRYRGKLEWPASGRLLRKFGVYRDPEFATQRRQNGIDISLKKGSEVRAVYSGTVVYADWFKSYGNLIIIDHGKKIVSFYAHNSKLLVTKGDYVERNSPIALSGDTGSLDGPMLHFEIRNKTQPEDPQDWLKSKSKKRRKRR